MIATHTSRHLNPKLTNIFVPGRRVCVGKGLALAQIRLVVAQLLTKYRIKFGPDVNPDTVIRDMRDQMTAQVGRFNLVFEPRT